MVYDRGRSLHRAPLRSNGTRHTGSTGVRCRMPSAEHQQAVALIRSMAAEAPADASVEASRARLDQMGTIFPIPDGIDVEPLEVEGVRCQRFRPAHRDDAAGGCILYLHGGAYTAGSLVSHGSLTGRLARACGCEVLSVEYRLAPEHPHPAALEDATTVYRHLVSQGADPASVTVAGDSAGAGLAVALLLALRDAGDRMPSGAVLISPWLDLTVSSDSITALAADDPILTAESLITSAQSYAGDDLKDPLVSPVFADPAGLPPLLILASTADILVDDSRTFAERARAAGVDVDLDVEEGLIHVWPAIDGVPEAAAALDRISAWIR
ncbi:MAG: alpha/beta hydrolase [Mycobacteriales bacterium]